MEIIFIKNKIQDSNTIDFELINGKRYYWKVKQTKLLGTLQDEIEKLTDLNLKYLLIYNVKSCGRYFSDQTGISTGHALILESFRIKHD